MKDKALVYVAEEIRKRLLSLTFNAFTNQRRTIINIFMPQPHSHMQSFPAPLQYFPRKVPRLNGSQNWFSRNPAPAIFHFENPVTVEGIYWEGLWCEWKHGHYWKAWGASAATAFFLTHLSPPSLQNPINALPKVSNAVFWFMQIRNKNTYSTTDLSSPCYSDAQPCICLFFICFGLAHIYLYFSILKKMEFNPIELQNNWLLLSFFSVSFWHTD